VGATRPAKVDVQVIAATNRDLHREVAAGRFREDLLFRLNTIHVTVPPAATPAPEPPPAGPTAYNLDELRRDAVRRALATTEGHYGRAAALLGVSAKTMTKLAAEACPGQPAKRGRRRRKPLPR